MIYENDSISVHHEELKPLNENQFNIRVFHYRLFVRVKNFLKASRVQTHFVSCKGVWGLASPINRVTQLVTPKKPGQRVYEQKKKKELEGLQETFQASAVVSNRTTAI